MVLVNLVAILSAVVPSARLSSVARSKIAALQRGLKPDADLSELVSRLAAVLEPAGIFLEGAQLRDLEKKLKQALR